MSFDTVLEMQHGKEGYALPEKDRTRVFPHEGEIITAKTGNRFLKYLQS